MLIRPIKKIPVFPVPRPTLKFGADSKLFFTKKNPIFRITNLLEN